MTEPTWLGSARSGTNLYKLYWKTKTLVNKPKHEGCPILSTWYEWTEWTVEWTFASHWGDLQIFWLVLLARDSCNWAESHESYEWWKCLSTGLSKLSSGLLHLVSSFYKKESGRGHVFGFADFFIISSYWMLSLHIITLTQGLVGVLRSNINKKKRQILIKHRHMNRWRFLFLMLYLSDNHNEDVANTL